MEGPEPSPQPTLPLSPGRALSRQEPQSRESQHPPPRAHLPALAAEDSPGHPRPAGVCFPVCCQGRPVGVAGEGRMSLAGVSPRLPGAAASPWEEEGSGCRVSWPGRATARSAPARLPQLLTPASPPHMAPGPGPLGFSLSSLESAFRVSPAAPGPRTDPEWEAGTPRGAWLGGVLLLGCYRPGLLPGSPSPQNRLSSYLARGHWPGCLLTLAPRWCPSPSPVPPSPCPWWLPPLLHLWLSFACSTNLGWRQVEVPGARRLCEGRTLT